MMKKDDEAKQFQIIELIKSVDNPQLLDNLKKLIEEYINYYR